MGSELSGLSSAIKKKGNRGTAGDLSTCLSSVEEHLRGRDYVKALIQVEGHARATAAAACDPDGPLPSVIMTCSIRAEDDADRAAVDETRLNVLMALEKSIKSRAPIAEQAANDILALCAVASILGVGGGDDGADEPQQQQPSVAPFGRYLSAAISLNVQRATSQPQGQDAEAVAAHLDLVETFVRALEKAAPPGSALAHRASAVVLEVLSHSATETAQIARSFVARSRITETADAVVSRAREAIDAVAVEALLEQAAAIVLRCRSHARFCESVVGDFAEKSQQAEAAWKEATDCWKRKKKSAEKPPVVSVSASAEQKEEDDEEPPSVDISAFLGGDGGVGGEPAPAVCAKVEPKPEPEPEPGRAREENKKPQELEPASLFPSSFFDLSNADPKQPDTEPPKPAPAASSSSAAPAAPAANAKPREVPRATAAALLEPAEAVLREITGLYVAIEDRFTSRVIAKLINDATAMPSSGSPSTLIDEAFYALTQSIERAAATMDAAAFVATAGSANERISTEIRAAVESWLRAWNSGATERRLDSFIAIVNDLETAARNTLQLREHATSQLAKRMPGCPQMQRIMACLDDFGHTAKTFRALATQNLTRLSKTVLANVHASIESFMVTEYRLTEAQFEAFEVNDPFMHELINILEPTLDAFLRVLNPGNGDILLEIVAIEVVKQIEDVVKQKKFTQYGGIQFTKDLQAFSDFCSRKSKTPMHGKFVRARQIAQLLTLDRPRDALEYVSGEHWKIEPDEAKVFLLLRSDFSSAEVRELQFTVKAKR